MLDGFFDKIFRLNCYSCKKYFSERKMSEDERVKIFHGNYFERGIYSRLIHFGGTG